MPAKKPKLALSSLRIRNFKAIIDSRVLKLSPLTVLIGNNGSGKSSILEALGVVQSLATTDVDLALAPFRGLEHIRHKAAVAAAERQGRTKVKDPATGHMQFVLTGWCERKPIVFSNDPKHRESFSASVSIGTERGGETVQVVDEQVQFGHEKGLRSIRQPRAKALQRTIGRSVESWQFLDMNPRVMGQPGDRRRSSVRVALEPDGSNLAEYLLDMRDGTGTIQSADRAAYGRAAFDGFVAAMQQVLPYASDLRPVERDYLERKVFLELLEGGGEHAAMAIPGWLLSTGTLRIAALLAVLRHPEPPPLVCVEEIENGLDPRTLQLLVSEIQYAVNNRGIQVITTSHSPHFLDLVPLDTIVFVERGPKGPTFTRPVDNEELKGWAEKFSPGKMYTMGTMTGIGSGG